MKKLFRLMALLVGLLAAVVTVSSGQTVHPTPESKIMALLDSASSKLGTYKEKFERQDSAGEKSRVKLSAGEARILTQVTAEFFRALGSSENGPPLTREHLQHFRENYRGGMSEWNSRHLAVERALMMGRSQITQEVWMETLTEFIRERPGDAALIVGEIDIGSWVDMKLGGLNFPADIDFSSVAVNPRGNPPDVNVNQEIVDLFERKLKARTGLGMVAADALLTPHGSASEHVFIGDWGKAYAEMELLRPGAIVKVLDRYPPAEGKTWGEIRLTDGKPTLKSKPGPQLFWEIAFATGKPVEFPKLDLTKEPMTTLEMWRHLKFDISAGPFSDAQKLMKLMKYLERSDYVNEKATAEYRSSLPGGDPDLLKFARDMVSAKSKKLGGEDIERIVKAYVRFEMGEDLTQENYGTAVAHIEAKARIAMIDNSVKAIACRFTQMAAIEDAAARGQALEKFYTDLGTEAHTCRENGLPVPEFVEQACAIAKSVHDGNLPPEALKGRAAELKRILEQSYKLEHSDIERLLNYDAYAALTRYFKQKCKWPDDKINDLVFKLRKKFPDAGKLYDDVVKFNEEWNRSLEGSKVLSSLEFADNALAIYDSVIAGETGADKVCNGMKTMLWLKAAGKFPILNVGASCWEAYEQGKPGPAIKAIAFYYMPTVGAFVGLGEKLQRFDTAANDANFYRNVVLVHDMCRFKNGHLTRVMIPGAADDLTIPEGASEEQRLKAFLTYFMGGGDANFLGSGNVAIRYWATLIPRELREYGAGGAAPAKTVSSAPAGTAAAPVPVQATKRDDSSTDWDLTDYVTKMRKLRQFFPFSSDLDDVTRLLEDVHAKPPPQDAFAADRNRQVEAYENQIEAEVWTALFKMLEAAEDPDLEKMKAELADLEHTLSVGDLALGRGKGITSLVKAELATHRNFMDGGHKFGDKFVYMRYLASYRRVKAIQDILVLFWTKKYGVDWSAITAASPMKMLFGGGTTGSPSLSGSPEKDQAIAEACLEGHLKREERIFKDLESALRRRVDPETDQDLVFRVAQLEFEIEHLIDDCERRRKSGGSEEVRAGITERQKKLDDLLAELRKQNVRFLITGKTLFKVGDTVELAAKVEGMSDHNRSVMHFVWSDNLGETDHVRFKADKAGKRTVSYIVKAPMQGQLVKYGASAPFALEIKGGAKTDENPALQPKLEIISRDTATVDEKMPLAAKVTNISSDQLQKYRYKWYNDTDRLSLGRGLKAYLTPRNAMPVKIRLEASLLDPLGTEIKVAETSREIKVLPRKQTPPDFSATWARMFPADTSSSEKKQATEPAKPSIVIHAPDLVTAGDPVEVTVELSPELRAVAKRIKCEMGSADNPECSGLMATSFKFWPKPGCSRKTENWTIRATVYDKYENARMSQLQQDPSPGSHNAAAPSEQEKVLSQLLGVPSATKPAPKTLEERWYIAESKAATETRGINIRPIYMTSSLGNGWVGDSSSGNLRAWVSRLTPRKDVKSGDSENFRTAASVTFDASLALYRLGCDFVQVENSAAFKDDPVGYEAAKCALPHITSPKVDANRGEILTPIEIAGYKGYLLESRIDSEKGGPPAMRSYFSVIYASASWTGWFIVSKGSLLLTGKITAGAVGGWDGQDDEKVLPAAKQMREEALNVLKGFRFQSIMSLTPGTPVPVTPADTGNTVAPMVAEIMSVTPKSLKAGESAEVTAAVIGGKPPYVFKWSGARSTKGDGKAISTPRFPGQHMVQLEVRDALNNLDYKYATIDVAAQPPVLTLPPRVKFGETASLLAKVEPLDGQYRFDWRVGMADCISVEGNGQSQVDFTFQELGELPVYVEVFLKDEYGQYRTYSLSEKPTIAVDASKFNVTFEPSSAKPGDEVLATVTPDPERLQDLVRYVWQTPESSNRWIYSDSESKIGFKIRDNNAVPLKAVAVLKQNNQAIGQVNASYASSAYTVKATLVGPANRGPRPMVWSNTSGGLVPVDQSTFGPDESALVRAEIVPETDKVRWLWAANEGTTIQSSELSREIRVTRSSPGTATLTVMATDPDKVQLGMATVSFTVANTPNVRKAASLEVSLGYETNELFVGASAGVRATVQGGRPPYQFSWRGDHQGDGPLTSFVATRAGLRKLICQVSDSGGQTASAVATFTVNEKGLKLMFEATGNIVEEPVGNTVSVMDGEVITLTLKPEEGRPPYTAVWTGPVTGQGLSVTCQSPATVKAVVRDAAAARAEIEITLAQPRGLFSSRPKKTRTEATAPGSAKKDPGLNSNTKAGDKTEKVEKEKPAAEVHAHADPNGDKIEAENMARRLRDEGAALQKKGKLKEAVVKYRESLKYYPDVNMENHIRKLEDAIQRQ